MPINREAPPLEITVVICTRDRAAQLALVLRSAAAMAIPDGLAWELCVVDNGSSDNTREVVEGFRNVLPVRCVREEAAGLSHARNRGVAEAAGRYICWTDDDVEIDPDWLAAYAAAFRRHPEAAIFGGRILPKLEANGPAWFSAMADRWPLTTVLARRDFGDAVIPLTLEGGRTPWGANFAVRAAEQRHCAYDPNLGVSPRQKRLGEEAEVIFQIMQAGGTGWWVPDAKVRHIIPLRRQSRSYLREYFSASGETLAYLEHAAPGVNHMSVSPAARAPAHFGRLRLSAQMALARTLYGACRLLGANLRSLYYLRRLAVLEGVQAYRRRARPS